ncbi:two-component system activity regulator YycH [Gemella cuniculi]|uniref:two-component system activity regulator YycH n=1 Tax=Gemella cuniculi TaxID=150240 RepID=UPI0003F7AA3D|nr:two-component system activity regulator YycH [Gemella cuniculi]
MKKNKKETIKSIILVLLVISSLVLSYIITTYQPDYEIFTRRLGQKITVSGDAGLLNFMTPDSMVKTEAGVREEAIVPNSITKVATVEAIKNKKVLKDILLEISKTESTESRIRNRNVEELTSNNAEKLTINYSVALDSALVKPLFFSEETSNVSLEFDTIVFLKDKPNTIYLYKKDDKNYLQINLKENIYDKIADKFNQNKQEYAKYSLNNKFIYLKEKIDDKNIDEYSAEEVNLTKLAKDIFEKKDNLKVSSDNEVTDGYAILKAQGSRIIYTNPSNEGGKEVGATTAITNAVDFLELGYANDINYQITNSVDGITIFQETYKESIVFNKEGHADIIAEDNSNGIYRLTSPKKITKTYLSSREVGTYDVERTEYVINYLYKYINLTKVNDIVLGYEKTYNKDRNSCSYTPTWYIKYNDRYISFKKLKESIDKGVQL